MTGDTLGNPVWQPVSVLPTRHYKFNRVIAITETACDTGYHEIRCLTGLFYIVACQRGHSQLSAPKLYLSHTNSDLEAISVGVSSLV